MLKNSDLLSWCKLPIEKDLEDPYVYYDFEKFRVIANQNNDLLELIYDNRLKNLEFNVKKQEFKLSLEETKSDYDIIWNFTLKMNYLTHINSSYGLFGFNSWNYPLNDKINFDKVKLKLKSGNGDPYNNLFEASYGIYSFIGGIGINEWDFLNFKNGKDIPLDYRPFKEITNKDVKHIKLNEKINVEFLELKEFLTTYDNKLILSAAAVLRVLIVRICIKSFGENSIKNKIKNDYYNNYEELINYLKKKKHLNRAEAKWIKEGVCVASKILHGKTDISNTDYYKFEISFIYLLELVNKIKT